MRDRLSLRARITVLASALFTVAVATGSALLVVVLRLSLLHELNSSADRTASDIAGLAMSGRLPSTLDAGSGGVLEVQVVDGADEVVAATRDADAVKSILRPEELARVRRGGRIEVDGARFGTDETLQVTAQPAGGVTVLVVTGLSRVQASERILVEAALIGGPVAVAAMALLTWAVVGLALRPVAALRAGAQEITAAGLSDQRLPEVGAHDEIHRLAVTLNAMLDRIDTSTTRQRTFVGDAAHELRSPLASLRVQLEVAARLPDTDWPDVVTDVLVDVDRLDRLVGDLLALARLDESGGALRHRESVDVADLVRTVAAAYGTARVPVLVSGGGGRVSGDAEALRRVLVNLLDNAVRHATTSVTVRVDHSGFEVVDDGPGIAAADREHVFDRFYRGDASRSRESGGTGLGLAIVRDLVRAHGGSIQLADATPGLRALVSLPPSPTGG